MGNNKEAIRAYLQQRQSAKTPPPSLDEIRRRLGWSLKIPTKEK